MNSSEAARFRFKRAGGEGRLCCFSLWTEERREILLDEFDERLVGDLGSCSVLESGIVETSLSAIAKVFG